MNAGKAVRKRTPAAKQLPTESIDNHGVVGDLKTVALVDVNGTIDFMCWPRFESPSVFASLLDAERGGSFELAPELGEIRRRQMYLPDTNVLLSRFLSAAGVAEISDFMTVTESGQRLIRRVHLGDPWGQEAISAFSSHVLGRSGPGNQAREKAQPASPIGPLEQWSR